MIDHQEIAGLREAFSADAATTPAPEHCVAPETIWAAVRGTVPPATVREVIEHTAACASCAEDWRLAVAFCDPHQAALPYRRRSLGRLLRVSGLAAAAALIVAVGATVVFDRSAPPEGQVFRQSERAGIGGIASLIAEGETLARESCELRWTSAGPPGTTYGVTVSTPELRVVAFAKGLTTPAFQVPADSLAELPGPATLLWRVEATLPSGERLTSPTFTTTIQ